jgi:hypothetical protein
LSRVAIGGRDISLPRVLLDSVLLGKFEGEQIQEGFGLSHALKNTSSRAEISDGFISVTETNVRGSCSDGRE